MIGPGTRIRGTVTGDEDLVVEGGVEGAIRLSKDLSVGKSATLEASVDAQNVHVDGHIQGDVNAHQSLNVSKGATLIGNVTTPRVRLADGAHFQGHIHMEFDVPAID